MRERYSRGDSACYENNLLDWLSSSEREQEPGGRIGFAISAVMSPQFAQTIAELPEADWTTYDTEPDGSGRRWSMCRPRSPSTSTLSRCAMSVCGC